MPSSKKSGIFCYEKAKNRFSKLGLYLPFSQKLLAMKWLYFIMRIVIIFVIIKSRGL